MKLTCLGTGSFFPQGGRNTSSYLLETKKSKILFDMGRGSVAQLYKEGHCLGEIDAIFITHTHQDHALDLLTLFELSFGKYSSKDLFNPNLVIYGPKGIKKIFKRIPKLFGSSALKNQSPLIVEVKDGDIYKRKDFSVEVFKVEHSSKKKSFAYRLRSERKVFVYSGDTNYNQGIVDATKNATLAILEATSTDEKMLQFHLSGELAGKIARESKVKQLVLTHVEFNYLKSGRVLRDAKKEYSGPVRVAKDGLKINF